MEQKKPEDAIKNFSKALKCNPNHHAAQAIMLHLMQQNCMWENLDSHIEVLRRSASAAAESPESVFSPFVFVALPGTTPEEQKCCAEKWVQSEYHGLVAIRPQLAFVHKRPRNEKIAIAYLSADFRDHPVARLMAEVFELHNRDRFRIAAYSYGPNDGGEMRKRLKNTFDKFVDIRGYSDVDSASRIYADNTDILVDLTGYTKDSRTGILALRPAPAQVNYLGYPGTMGAPFMDYIITDRFVTPPEAQVHFSEKFVYMPHSFLPNDRKKEIAEIAPGRKACGLPEQGFVFCCFNKSYKLTNQVFAVWMRLLKAIPGSVLWLSDCSLSAVVNLQRETRQHMVDPSRVVFAPRVNTVAEHLARHQHADLFLDTLPYNAHTTCSDALWMGLPVVTCAGETFPSRVAGSLLSAMEVPELITYNLEDYYRLALDLATDTKKLDAIRIKIIANRDTAPLFDSALFTRNLEGAYIKLMHNFTRDMDSR
jgi:predicted O-linked N-acetylglucosamine transferase (SPINDLY family)